MRRWGWAGVLASGLVAACAQNRLPPPFISAAPPVVFVTPTTAPPPQASVDHASFSNLPGWAQEDHAAALAAFAVGCSAARAHDMAAACRRARDLGPVSDATARWFFETRFRLEALAQPGLLTAYFSPVYAARAQPDGEFSSPVRPRPVDLAKYASPMGGAYGDRADIEARPADDAVAWMRAEDLFFLQIQGSGVLIFPDGRRARAIYDGVNGARFVGIAAPMRRQGLLADNQTSGDGIRGWLAAHRGPQADAIMRLNPRFVFFRLADDDGGEPAGAAGIPLPAGRAVAVDPSEHAMGDLLWVDATAPSLSGALPAYRRLVLALDAGGAIKGPVRADLYIGRGDAAGLEAGRVRHVLRLYRLTPIPEFGG